MEKVRLAEEYAQTLQRTSARMKQRDGGPSEDADSIGLAALAATTRGQIDDVFVQISQLAKDMGTTKFQERLEDAINNLQTPKDSTKLILHGGELLDLFDARSWAVSCPEFLYGDCTPNLQRPRKIGMGTLFACLSEREELEYHLESDATDPNIPDGRYCAPLQPRWDTGVRSVVRRDLEDHDASAEFRALL